MTVDEAPAFFRGEWLTPGNDGYDQSRAGIFNTRRDPRPPVVARCLGNADVVAALAHARAHGYEIAVRSTGWSLEGHSASDGLTIDMSLMRCVSIDPATRTAWIQGGTTTGDIQVEAGRHNLAAVGSLFSGNGVGFMLGGGVGHLARRAGYSSSNIIEVEMVTAAGEVVIASPQERPDLFWAVRGTQGNFGVVTGLRIQLHEVPRRVLAGDLIFSNARAGDALRAIGTAAEWASDDLSLLSFHDNARSLISLCHFGPPDVAAEEVARLVNAVAPDESTVAPTSFRDLTFVRDGEYWPARVSLDHEIQASALSDEVIRAIEARLLEPMPGSTEGMSLIEAHPCFRAMSRAPEHPSAAHPGPVRPHWAIVPLAAWGESQDDDAFDAWVLDSVAALRSAAEDSGVRLDGFGTNAMGSVEESFGASLPQLRELKRVWDPDNLFRANLNIRPATGGMP